VPDDASRPGPAALIPREILFGNPERVAPTLSPDGTRLGFVAPVDGVLNVWVGPADDVSAARPVTNDRGHGVRVFTFAHDDRTLLYLRDSDGNEDWRLSTLDLETGVSTLRTPAEGVTAQILGHNRWHPTQVLIGLNDRDATLHDVHRLDLATGELTLVETNPGFAAWLIDSDLQVRGGTSVTPDGGAVVHLRDGDEWRPWLTIDPEDVNTTDVLGHTRDGSGLLLLSSIGVNAARLVRVDLATGAEVVLAEDPDYDIGDVVLDPETLEPVGVVVVRDRGSWQFLDAGFAADVTALQAQLSGELGISRRQRDGRVWLVSDAPSDGPVSYYRYHRESGALEFLFAHKPALADHQLAPMEPFSFTARDGLTVHGYVTFPVGVPREGLPGVLNVHGGPWVRDTWGYDPEVQWLANRGYLAIQVNYRGSTGYGKAFGNAGDKQWGAAMHDDLVDAVEHLVGAGVLDRDRVGIYGGSYGGYAALVGAAFTPTVFRCAIDIVGPSNLLTLLASVPEYWKPMLAMMHAKIGDPATESDLLWSRSPLSRVDDITIPVLVAQGRHDPRVKVAEAEQIVAALTEKGIPHEYLLFEDEGHGLARPENREVFYAAAERFLATHLGGRSEG
jgi:dipeptidyl aminopeptidase/acylaminoacyl peptidase